MDHYLMIWTVAVFIKSRLQSGIEYAAFEMIHSNRKLLDLAANTAFQTLIPSQELSGV